jgi:hypothetical protein
MGYLNTDTQHESGDGQVIQCAGRGEICFRGNCNDCNSNCVTVICVTVNSVTDNCSIC